PSAPAATPAMAIASTSSQWPVPWLGSTKMGRCESFLTTGTAFRSSVYRVEASKVRIPRSQRMTFGLPRASTYSADRSHSWIVVAMPRFRRTGFPASPTRLSSEKFCTLRAPTWRMAAGELVGLEDRRDGLDALEGLEAAERVLATIVADRADHGPQGPANRVGAVAHRGDAMTDVLDLGVRGSRLQHDDHDWLLCSGC